MKKDSKDKKMNISEKINGDKHKRIIGVVILLVVLIIAVVVFFVTDAYKPVFEFLGFDVSREYVSDGITVSFSPHGEYGISAADDTIVVFDENGVTGYDNGGVWKWHSNAKFVAPVLKSYDDFVLISDSESRCVSAFDSTGIIWTKTFDNKIRNAIVHEGTDFISIITESSEYNSEIYIIDYKQNSKVIFSGKFVDEYIISTSIAPDRSQFVLSGFFQEGEHNRGVIMFLRMSDGEVFATEIFDELYPYAEYIDRDTVIAANSDSMLSITKTASVDVKSDKKTTLWSRNGAAEILLSIDALPNDGFCASFGVKDDINGRSSVRCYDASCELLKTKEYSERINTIKAGYQNYLFASDTSVFWVSKEFEDKCSYTSLSDVECLDFVNSSRVLVQMKSRMMIVCFNEKE